MPRRLEPRQRGAGQGRAGRASRLAFVVGIAGLTGISLQDRGITFGGSAILGMPPDFGPAVTATVPNRAAIDRAIWMPDLAAGWDPQGLAWAGNSLFVSAYKSHSVWRYRGPCRIFRLDPETGRETGRLDVPAPCGHAGGLAATGDGRLFLADTHTLFAVGLDTFAGAAPGFRTWPLAGGLGGGFAASAPGAVWIGTYSDSGPGRRFEFRVKTLDRLAAGAALEPGLADRSGPVPSYAQGAAFDRDGTLWLARSDLAWGWLETFDPATGRRRGRYPMPGGIEGIAFDPRGRLWAVSEAGSRHLPLDYPFFPLVFRLDSARLERHD